MVMMNMRLNHHDDVLAVTNRNTLNTLIMVVMIDMSLNHDDGHVGRHLIKN
jgi:hypothetical protein